MIQDEMIKLKSQWEMLAREREDKLQSELQQRLVEATERLELEDKVEDSWREIKRYQDTLAQSQEQLQSAQMMIEESHERSVATHEKLVSTRPFPEAELTQVSPECPDDDRGVPRAECG